MTKHNNEEIARTIIGEWGEEEGLWLQPILKALARKDSAHTAELAKQEERHRAEMKDYLECPTCHRCLVHSPNRALRFDAST